MGWIAGFIGLISSLKSIAEIGWQIFQILRQYYDREQRAHVAKEISAAVKESRETMDNTRLINVLNPSTDPFPRKIP